MPNDDNANTSTHNIAVANTSTAPEVPPRQRPEVSRVSIKLPPFWKPNVKLWFLQIESQFATCSIVTEETKFHYVMGAIESDVLSRVSDFLLDLPRDNKYSNFKEKLIAEFSDSEVRKAKRLLKELELGDRKPSSLLREMRELAGSDISDQFLRNMFLQNLPETIRSILICSKDSLDSLAQMADKILDASPPNPDIYSVTSSGNKMEILERQIAELTHAVKNLTTHNTGRDTARNGGRSRSRSHSRTRNLRKFPQCWYHYRYGVNAKRCDKPCDFGTAKTNSEN